MPAPSYFHTRRPISPDRLRANLQLTRQYLIERQSPDGGFCFYRGYYLEEPNLADTFHGLSAWKLLTRDALPAGHDHVGFVLRHAVEQQPFALYFRVNCLIALDVSDPAEAQVREAVSALPLILPDMGSTALQSPLKRLAHALWLKRHCGVLDASASDLGEALLATEGDEGGYGNPPNLVDTVEALRVLALCSARPSSVTVGFVRSLGIPGFGFQLTAHSLSPNLETTSAGIESSALLGTPVEFVDDALDFVLACQTGNGGYALRPGALPDLAWTHLALRTLCTGLDIEKLEHAPVRHGP